MTFKNALPILVISCFYVFSTTSAKSAEKEIRTISVSGTAITKVTPDMVVWQLSTTANHKDLLKAKEKSDKQIQAILKAAREFKIAAKDIQTGQLNIDKEYKHRKYGDRGDFKHYSIRRTVTLIQRNIEIFDALLTKLIQSTNFEVNYQLARSNLEEVKAKTRLKAVAAAKNKASDMVKELDEKLGRVLKIEENSVPNYRGQTNVVLGSLDSANSGSGKNFAAGVIDVRISIRAIFAIH